MATLHGAPLPEDFKAGDPLTADDFNAVKDYWIVDELPEDAVDGDVVFVIGDSPVGGNELPGIGGWAEITDVSGSPKRYAYPDPADPEWVAFEWTQDGSVTTDAGGLVDALIVGAGGNTDVGSTWAGQAGGAIEGVTELHTTSVTITVGKVGTGHNNASAAQGGFSQFGDARIAGGNNNQTAQPNGYLNTSNASVIAGAGSAGDAPDANTGGPGHVSSIRNGSEETYARGGGLNAWPDPRPGDGGDRMNNGGAAKGQPGVVIIRVPAALTEKVDPGKWVTRSNYFAVVENGVVTETYTEHHYGNGTTTPLPQTDLIPCDANVTEGYSYENGEFVSPPAPEIPAAQQEILDKINELQQELRSYDV